MEPYQALPARTVAPLEEGAHRPRLVGGLHWDGDNTVAITSARVEVYDDGTMELRLQAGRGNAIIVRGTTR